jgi:two-component system, sensor histidine kinase and response regulator
MSARPSAVPVRLLVEILAIAALCQAGAAAAVAHLAPDEPAATRVALAVLLALLVAAPPIYARCIAATRRVATLLRQRRAGNGHRARVQIGNAVAMTAAVQALGLVLAATGTYFAMRSVEHDTRMRFERSAEQVETEIRRRLRSPLHALYGARGAFAASARIERAEFRAFVESYDFARAFPNLRSVGFIERVPRAQLDAFTARERADGAPDFQVTSSGDHADLYVVKFAEPQARYAHLLGLDIGAEPRRREAALHAIDSGEPTMTRPITLNRDTAADAGLLIFVPVYAHGRSVSDARQRRNALVGMLYVAIAAPELLRDVTASSHGELDARVYVAQAGEPPRLVFDSTDAEASQREARTPAPAGPPLMTEVHRIEVAGRTLDVHIEATPAFARSIDRSRVQLVAVGGVGISFLLSLLVWLLASGRVRAESRAQTLTRELDRLARVVRHTANAVVITDAELHITWVNEAFTRASGYSALEAIGQPVHALLRGPDDEDAVIQPILDTLMSGRPLRREMRCTVKDGRVTWQDIDAQPMHDDQGRLSGVMLLATDVTEQRQTRQQLFTALRESQALLGTLHRHAIVSVTDSKGRITDVNPAFCTISGYRRDELIGHDHRVVNSGHHDAAFWSEVWRTISAGQPWRGLICNRHKDGTVYWVDSMIAPYVGNDGRIDKYVSIRIEVTDRVRAQEQLADERLRLDNILRGTHVGTWEWNVQTGATVFNERWAEMVGYTLDELGPTTIETWGRLVHPQDLERSSALLERHFSGQDSHYACEARMRHKDGHWVWVLDRGKLFSRSDDGAPLRMAGTHMDITARKHAEAALRASQAFLDRVSRVAQVGGWELELSSGTQRWSDEALRILGLARDSVPTLDEVVARLAPEAQAALREALFAACEDGTPWDMEWPLLGTDDQRVWVRWIGEVEYDAGHARRVFGTVQDVTPRRGLQLALQRQNEVLASVLENLPCGLSVFDGELRLVAHNRQYRTLLGFPDALFDEPHPTFESFIRFNAERGEYGACDVEALVAEKIAMACGPAQLHAFERLRPNGVPLEVRGAPLPGGGFVTTYADISDRKRAAAEIARSAAVLRGAIDTVDEAFVLYDPEDRLVVCNEKYRSLYATSAPAIVPGARFEDVIRYGAERGQYRDAIGRVDEWVAERMVRHRTSSHSSIQTLDDGRVLRVIERRMADGHTVGFRVDISDLVRATRVAEEASAAKSRFLANMSHELRTPMNAILGMLRLLQRTPLNAHQADYGSKAEGAARSLLGLLDDILDFSKIEAGKLTLDPRPFAVEHLLRDLAVVLSHSLGDKPVELLFDIDPALPSRLLADDLRLRQVLINLCGNAIKFTPHGEVVLRLRVLAADTTRVRVACSVSDTGIGISPEHHARIFSGFTQAEASTTRRYGGTGLGVAISQRLVALMGGTLQLDSSVGVGSTFSFEIDLCPAPAEVPALAAPSVDVPAPAVRCLIVDDNARARDVLGAMAQALGWHASTAGSPDEALASAARTPGCFHAVLFDATMPGLDARGWLRSLRALGSIDGRSVAVSMAAQGGELPAASQEAAAAHLVKPFTRSMLAHALGAARAAARRGDAIHTAPSLPAATTPQRLAGLRLLVVEDNANNQQIARELLTDEGAHVSVAADGALAVQHLADRPTAFDAVLMDLQMPVMDGLTATREIRQRLGLRTLPIIAMTANAMDADRQACLDAGMDAHVGKPFDLDTLVAVLLQHGGAAASAARRPPEEAIDAVALALIDVDAALARMAGKRAVYARALDAYVADLPRACDKAAAHLAAGDRAAARRLMHSHKGMAATLGAAALSRLAARLEMQFKDDPAGPQDHSLLSTWQRGVDLAQPALARAAREQHAAQATRAQHAPPLPAATATQTLRDTLDELLALLREGDLRALDVIERTRLLVAGTAAADGLLRALTDAVATLDFATAATLCEQALARAPVPVADEA